jgi:hypothetical protein
MRLWRSLTFVHVKRGIGSAAAGVAAAVAIGIGLHPGPAAAASHCVGAEEARVHAAGDDDPVKFTAAFYRRLFTLDVSLDGADGSQLPISIEQVCDVPRRLRKQAAQLAGGDGVAVLLRRTTVWQDGTELFGRDAATAIDGADTASIRVRMKRPPGWSEDEDGNPVPTFRAGRVEITD